MITMGDYRQLSDALFHAGTRSGSEYEFIDEANRLHFYVLDVQAGPDRRAVVHGGGEVPGRRPAGRARHGVALGKGEVTTGGKPTNRGVTCSFPLTNTGAYSAGGQQHPENAAAYLKSDVYRLSAAVAGKRLADRGCRTRWPPPSSARATTVRGRRWRASRRRRRTGFVKLTATSESDPTKTVTKQCRVDKTSRGPELGLTTDPRRGRRVVPPTTGSRILLDFRE